MKRNGNENGNGHEGADERGAELLKWQTVNGGYMEKGWGSQQISDVCLVFLP